jgi:hypothetical protein
LLTRLLATIGMLGLGWSVTLALTGGFEITIGPLSFSSHDPWRPAAGGALALALFRLLGGRLRAPEPFMWIMRHGAWARIRPWHLAAVLALAVAIVGALFTSTVAGGSDSYGYVSQAALWRQGRLVQDQLWALEAPWPRAQQTFAPLGYRPSTDDRSIVPVYSIGLPLLMAAAQTLAGTTAAFWVAPVAGGLVVWMTFLVGR